MADNVTDEEIGLLIADLQHWGVTLTHDEMGRVAQLVPRAYIDKLMLAQRFADHRSGKTRQKIIDQLAEEL